MKSSRTLCGTLLAALLLSFAGCSGNSKDDTVVVTPVADTFVTAVQNIASNAPDGTEPVSIDAFAATLPDDVEPVSL